MGVVLGGRVALDKTFDQDEICRHRFLGFLLTFQEAGSSFYTKPLLYLGSASGRTKPLIRNPEKSSVKPAECRPLGWDSAARRVLC
jgi:hypothetical protein